MDRYPVGHPYPKHILWLVCEIFSLLLFKSLEYFVKDFRQWYSFSPVQLVQSIGDPIDIDWLHQGIYVCIYLFQMDDDLEFDGIDSCIKIWFKKIRDVYGLHHHPAIHISVGSNKTPLSTSATHVVVTDWEHADWIRLILSRLQKYWKPWNYRYKHVAHRKLDSS